MDRADIILTDSGGIQEEALSLSKPVLVMRDTTERPEAIEAGLISLVGTDKINIKKKVKEILDEGNQNIKMRKSMNPYGNGNACERIVEELVESVKLKGISNKSERRVKISPRLYRSQA